MKVSFCNEDPYQASMIDECGHSVDRMCSCYLISEMRGGALLRRILTGDLPLLPAIENGVRCANVVRSVVLLPSEVEAKHGNAFGTRAWEFIVRSSCVAVR